MKKSLEMVEHEGQKIFAVEGEAFDWGIDPGDLDQIRIALKRGQVTKEQILSNIQTHFLGCFSEFIGRYITFAEIHEAVDRGYIELEDFHSVSTGDWSDLLERNPYGLKTLVDSL